MGSNRAARSARYLLSDFALVLSLTRLPLSRGLSTTKRGTFSSLAVLICRICLLPPPSFCRSDSPTADTKHIANTDTEHFVFDSVCYLLPRGGLNPIFPASTFGLWIYRVLFSHASYDVIGVGAEFLDLLVRCVSCTLGSRRTMCHWSAVMEVVEASFHPDICCLQSKGGGKARACQAPGRNLQWFTSRLAFTLGLNDCSCCDSGFNRSLVPRPEGKFSTSTWRLHCYGY
jgi:hypothetical protein